MLELYYNVREYHEELLTLLFDFTNKIEIGVIINEFYRLINEDEKKMCTNLGNQIRSLKTKHIIANYVSCFTIFMTCFCNYFCKA